MFTVLFCLVAGGPLSAQSRPATQLAGERLLWEKTFDHGGDECAYAVVSRPDGGFVLAANSGKYNKFGQGSSKVWLVACDAEGNKESRFRMRVFSPSETRSLSGLATAA